MTKNVECSRLRDLHFLFFKAVGEDFEEETYN